ncbi:MAG: F0F1 ATP synthase subunit B [Pseudomonadota bacterium]
MNFNATLIGQTIAMIFFVWFCMKYIWPPIMAAIEARQKEIADGLAAAERGKASLATAEAEIEAEIKKARGQAAEILDQAHARANEIVAEGKAEGQRERERQLTAARAEIEQETHKAREELRGQVSAIAVASAEKILNREIDASAHNDLLSKLAAQI